MNIQKLRQLCIVKIEDHKDLVLVQFFPRDLGCHTAGEVFCLNAYASSVKREYKLQYKLNLLKLGLGLRKSWDSFIPFIFFTSVKTCPLKNAMHCNVDWNTVSAGPWNGFENGCDIWKKIFSKKKLNFHNDLPIQTIWPQFFALP